MMMWIRASFPTIRALQSALALVSLMALLALLAPAAGRADITTFGSPLSVPATLNTSEDLSYPGTFTPVPPAPDAPNGVFHTFHFGADTALWGLGGPAGSPRVPGTGQALKISVEGCAQSARGGPAPAAQVHFQDITPLPEGGGKVNISSQSYELPVCGAGGADSSTVTSYEPINLCVSEGDYVAFNDNGGYVPNFYRNGVPFQVLGAVKGATTDSFIKDQGTGNGAVMSASETSANDGFAVNRNVELMMRVTLGTGADSTHICPGGKSGLPPPLAPVRVSPQTDGVNQQRIVAVAVYCRVTPECKGIATLGRSDGRTYGRKGFSLTPNKTSHLAIRVSSELVRQIRRHHSVTTTLTAVVGGKRITQAIGVKIF